MKINIKNLLFQPLALHLATDSEGLHLSARECREILAERVSEEIQRAVARGHVSLSESTRPDPLVETAAEEPCPEPSRRDIADPVDDIGPQTRQKKRRER